MWYVIQTETGKEEEALLLMRQLLNRKLCSRYMLLEAEWPKRSRGQWILLRKAMFPGYIFVETREAEKLFFQLKQIPKLTKILGNGKFEFVPLEEKEIQFLQKISEKTEQNIQDSKEQIYKTPPSREEYCTVVHPSKAVVDKNGQIYITGGPLKAFEEEILRINLHKRYAVVKVKMLGEKTVLFGLVMEKDREEQKKLAEKLK